MPGEEGGGGLSEVLPVVGEYIKKAYDYSNEAKDKANEFSTFENSIKQLTKIGDSQLRAAADTFYAAIQRVGLKSDLAREDYYRFTSAVHNRFQPGRTTNLFEQVSYATQGLSLNREETQDAFAALGDMIRTDKVTAENIEKLGPRFQEILDSEHEDYREGTSGIKLAERLGKILESKFNTKEFTDADPARANRLSAAEELSLANYGRSTRKSLKPIDNGKQALADRKNRLARDQNLLDESVKRYGEFFGTKKATTLANPGKSIINFGNGLVLDEDLVKFVEDVQKNMDNAYSHPEASRNELIKLYKKSSALREEYAKARKSGSINAAKLAYAEKFAVLKNAQTQVEILARDHKGTYDALIPDYDLSFLVKNTSPYPRPVTENKFPDLQRIEQEAARKRIIEQRKINEQKQKESITSTQKESKTSRQTDIHKSTTSHSESSSKTAVKKTPTARPGRSEVKPKDPCGNTTINIGRLADITLQTNNVIEGGDQIKDIITKVLLEVLNDANQGCD